MTYPALPDRRMPYHRDGTVIGIGSLITGVNAYITGADAIAINAPSGIDSTLVSTGQSGTNQAAVWLFFPEQREVTALWMQLRRNGPGLSTEQKLASVEGSNDTTNGLDGTWQTATLGGGLPAIVNDFSWRAGIVPVGFTGPKRVVRFVSDASNAGDTRFVSLMHVYGEKAAGQTPDDVIFINHQDTPGAEYQSPQDFGDRPLGTTVTHQFRVKNASATKTANSINLQCNDADFVISTDNTTWVTTVSIASLASGAQSATLYARCTTPSPGNPLGPRFAEVVAVVGSWT